MLALNTATFANKCTDVAFSMNANPNISIDPNFHIDSIYTKSSTQKFIYANGKVAEVHEKGEKEQILYIYHDVDKTSLKNTGLEYILTKCEAQDTLCYVQTIYQDGVLFDGTLTIKATPEYISQEIEQPDYHQLTEFIIKPDTLLYKNESYERYMGYKVSMKSSSMLHVADPNDDTKCDVYIDDKKYATLSYNPNEKGDTNVAVARGMVYTMIRKNNTPEYMNALMILSMTLAGLNAESRDRLVAYANMLNRQPECRLPDKDT